MKKELNVVWIGPVAEPSGYGEASRNYLKQLVKHKNIQLKLVNKYFWGGNRLDLGDEQELFEELSDIECLRHLKTLAIFHVTPDHYCVIKQVQKQVCLTTFETDLLPNYWLMPIRSMDEVWTYTKFNKDTFREAGINNEIRIIPHGVDVNRFDKEKGVLKEIKQLTKERYVFGSMFDWHSRKNPEVLVEAFLRSFAGHYSDKVCLVLKTFYSHVEDGDAFIKEEIDKIRLKLGDNKKLPKIYLLSSILDAVDMPKFYNSLDCYVSPSRGEGWGLPFSEAMASGLPVIATNWSGNTEFMNYENSFLLPYKLVFVKEEEAKHHPYFKDQKWADVKMEDLMSMMMHVYTHKEEADKKGEKAKKDMISFSWEAAGDIMYENIERILL